jgi:mycofactocin biosynthesis protein MftB
VAVVESLGEQPTALAACREAGVTDQEPPAYRQALGRLARSGMVVEDEA